MAKLATIGNSDSSDVGADGTATVMKDSSGVIVVVEDVGIMLFRFREADAPSTSNPREACHMDAYLNASDFNAELGKPGSD